MKRVSFSLLLTTVVLLVIAVFTACTSQSSSVPVKKAAPVLHVTPTPAWGHLYNDGKLGFQLRVPDGWTAQAQPGRRNPQGITALALLDTHSSPQEQISLDVIESASMPTAFASRGNSNALVGTYPAFAADRERSGGKYHCLIRFFLAGNDFVTANWCSTQQNATHIQLFEQVLATYRPAQAGFVATDVPAPEPQTCQQLQKARGYTAPAWGYQLGSPSSSGWRGLLPGGAFICSNVASADPMLFQCTELANRFIHEQWALPSLNNSAGRYYDYYQDGRLHPGAIRDFPEGSYQLSDDASQGKSAFRPVPGDLLIFQDVNNISEGWKSGLTKSPGHVAVITAVSDYYVSVAQENYSDTQFFMALPITKEANGYAVRDLTGLSNRVVRGWIHFTANGGPAK